MRMPEKMQQTIAVVLACFFAGCVGNKQQLTCPWTCSCGNDYNMTVVSCTGQYWTSVPPLPHNTSVLMIQHAQFPTLQEWAFAKARGINLTTINFSGVTIGTIDGAAFQGLLKLRAITFTKCPINDHLANETFANLTHLEFLHLTGTKLTYIPDTALCQIENLSTLTLMSSQVTSARFGACFEHMTHLSIVALDQNPLHTVHKDDFFALRNSQVKTISLSGCKLHTLDADVFYYLPGLTTVYIANNYLTHLDPDLFASHGRIKALQVQGNRFSTIPDLNHTTWLKDINLSGNRIRKLYFPPVFLKMINLRSVDVGNNPLVTLHNRSFENLANSTRLTKLTISKAKLKTVEADSFSPLRQHFQSLILDFNPITAPALETALHGLRNRPNLKILSIMGTNLPGLSNTTFRYLQSSGIKQLKVQRILVEHVPTGVFEALQHLEMIDLKGAGIRDIGPDVFTPLKNLTTLNLKNNKLVDLPLARKTGLGSLKQLYVKGNPIQYLTATNCAGYFELLVFDASNCAVSHITQHTFQDMTKLQSLNLNTNKIAYIHVAAFEGLYNLKILQLRNNHLVINDAAVRMFGSLSNLQELTLRQNTNIARNATLFAVLISNLISLTKLDVSYTQLNELPQGIFDPLTQLKTLQLSANGISYWSPRVFRNQSHLELLTVRNNKITLINSTSLIYLKALRTLDVSGNPFACTCDLLWFKKWIYSSPVYIGHLGPGYACASPPAVRGKMLLKVGISEKRCTDFTTLWFMCGGALFYVLFVTMTTLLYRYKWYIRYWFYLLQSRRRQYAEGQDQTAYPFDAFVSYCYQDRLWVVRELLPRIEYQEKIRLCLHSRNWLAARSIYANIAESIQRSRKTVLVLSNNFAKSHWCEAELNMAKHELLKRGDADNIILILLEDIAVRNRTPHLNYLLTNRTYIPWPPEGAPRQRARFWNLLKKVLKPARPIYEDNPPDFVVQR